MPIKKALSVWLALCLSFQGWGCAVIAVTDEFTEKGKKPVSTKNFPVETKIQEGEEKTRFSSSKIEIISSMPSLPPGQKEYKKLRLTPRFSVADLQKASQKENLEIIVLPDTVVLKTASFDGQKWYTGWIEPKTVVLGKLVGESGDEKTIGIREYDIVRLGICGNAVQGLKIRVFPAISETTTQTTVEKIFRSRETFVNEKTVIKTQRNHWPWLITTAALIGLGFALWPEKEKKKEDPFCDPNGSPADR